MDPFSLQVPTPYARQEFERALEMQHSVDEVTRAWSIFVMCSLGMKQPPKTRGEWSRTREVTRGRANNTNSYQYRKRFFEAWHLRMCSVQIDHQDAVACVRYWDRDDAVFYLDPPYVHNTRTKGTTYVYGAEAGDDDHSRLVEALLSIKGRVMLSGYDTPLYDPLVEAGWHKIGRQVKNHAANSATTATGNRVEVLWTNYTDSPGLFQ